MPKWVIFGPKDEDPNRRVIWSKNINVNIADVLLTLAVLAVVVLVVVFVVGCERPKPLPTGTPATPTSAEDVNERNIRNLCDFFHFRPHEVLLLPDAQGNAKLYASRPGVPKALRDVVTEYYANAPTLPDDREILDNRYAAVITRCMEAGWTQ